MVPQQQRRRRRRAGLPRAAERRVVVARGAGGFGFTIAGQRPCVVSAVAAGGPAERAGLRAGDALLAVDGASVARAPHASVARLVAAAPGAISLSVAPREAPPTDTEDTEPDERARARRRHPPPRRRPQAMLHHLVCHAAPSTSGVNEVLQNLSRVHFTPSYAARLECRVVVGYLGTIETPQPACTLAASNVRSAARKLRAERRAATPVLLSVLPGALLLRRAAQQLAHYPRDRILHAGCPSDADRRFFGLVTSPETPEAQDSHSCHIFAVDPRMAEHDVHLARASEFGIVCTRDPVAERCLEFPPSAEYVVGVIRGMYSLPLDECSSPTLHQISKMAVKGDSPAIGNFSRCNRAALRVPRERRACRHEEVGECVANSPQPSNHSEITTTSSNSDSGIGFHNDCRNIADRILVVDFVGQQPPPDRFRQEMPRRPMGLVGCSSFDAEGSFLSNTTPVVDGFGGQGRPLNLDDIILNAHDLQPVRHVSPRNEDDNYNYNNVYGNLPLTFRNYNGVYDQVHTENDGHYELLPRQLDSEIDSVADTLNSVVLYEEQSRNPDFQSNQSVEIVTVESGGTSKTSMDSVSVYSSRSHEETRVSRRKHMQASLDDMLVLGMRDQAQDKDEGMFLHPARVKCKVRKSMKPLNIISRTRHLLTGKDKKEERPRAMSASAGNVAGEVRDPLPAAASEPDLRDQSEQSSPFRRWTTGSGAGSSYRHAENRTLYNKQMSAGSSSEAGSSGSGSSRGQWPNGGVARWSLGLEHLLADPVGRAAFAEFLSKEFAHENIVFWCSCEEFNKEQDPERRAALAKEIWERHLADTALDPVNVDATARRAALSRLADDPLPKDLFNQAQRQIFNVMRMDSYHRFLRSGEHAECARADLRGLPPPTTFALAASAAAGSRLAPAPPGPHSPETAALNLSDQRVIQGSPSRVVKSGPLCRVVLPDGATSVVSVDPNVTVRRLVDRLLQRRNINIQHYDVLYRDSSEMAGVIDCAAPSTVLGGREIIVEQRCVVRMEVGSRVVAVRCRPERRLRHVLRPVLARYASAPTAGASAGPTSHTPLVYRDGRLVHPDVSILELDGERVRVQELPEPAERTSVPVLAGRDEDTESLSELAFRDQDDQARSEESLQLPLEDKPNLPSGQEPAVCRGREAADAAQPGGPGHGKKDDLRPPAGGRVRAAIHQGAPLHHFQPRFLEQLEEIQQRHIEKHVVAEAAEGRAPPLAPRTAPRTPPPLPPKPQRVPSLV